MKDPIEMLKTAISQSLKLLPAKQAVALLVELLEGYPDVVAVRIITAEDLSRMHDTHAAFDALSSD